MSDDGAVTLFVLCRGAYDFEDPVGVFGTIDRAKEAADWMAGRPWEEDDGTWRNADPEAEFTDWARIYEVPSDPTDHRPLDVVVPYDLEDRCCWCNVDRAYPHAPDCDWSIANEHR
jgi:hypothetical protein